MFSAEASDSISSTNAVEMPERDHGRDQPGAAGADQPGARARPVRRGGAERGPEPGQRGGAAAGAGGQLAAAQQRRSPAGRPARQAGHAAAATGIATAASHAPASGSTSARPGAGSLSSVSSLRRRAVGGQRAGGAPERGGRRGDERRLERLGQGDVTGGGADRPLDPDRRQPPLHLGPGRGGQHHARGDQRDQRQRHQQVDDDAGGLVEQHAHPGAGGEAQVVQAEARAARLDQHLVEVARIAQPDLGVVDPAG